MIPANVINEYLAELDRLKDEAGYLAEQKVEVERKARANKERQAQIRTAVDRILYGKEKG